MAETTSLGFPLVDLTDIPNGPAQIDALAGAINDYLTPSSYSPIPLASGYALQNGVPSYAVRHDTVKLAGGISKTSGNMTSGVTLGTLPVAARPNRNVELACACTDATGFTTARIEVTPAGVISAFVATGQTGVSWVSLDGLEYELTVALS